MTDKTKISTFVSKACTQYDDATYTARTAYYKDKKRPELADFIAYLFNAAIRYIETGTKQHLDNAVIAGRATGRMKIAVRILKTASAHPWNGATGKFAGSMDKKRMANLRENDGWRHKFKVMADVALAADVKMAENETAWDMDKAILTLVKKAESEKGGKHSPKQIRDALEHALRQVEAA